MGGFSHGVATVATPFLRTATILLLILGINGRLYAQSDPQTATTPVIPTTLTDDPHLPPGIWHESPIVGRVAEEFEQRIAPVRQPNDGFFLEFGNSITGAGFPSAGPGYRQHLFNGAALFTAAGTISPRLYNSVEARLEFRHLAQDRITIGSQSNYRDSVRVNYFGLGADTDPSARSGYRLQAVDASVFAAVDLDPLRLAGKVGSLTGIRVSNMAGFDVEYPNTLAAFTDETAPGLVHQPSYLYTELSVAADRRNEPGHPTRGAEYQLTWARYADRDTGRESFDRYEVSATRYLSAGADNWILSLHAFSALSRTAEDSRVPFYLTPSLGGKSTLRGYRDYRFHGDQMILATMESRWAVLKHLDLAAFGELGRIGSRVDDLWTSDLKGSMGIGIRYHSDRFMIGRADIAVSPEGWRVIFAMTEPLQRTRSSAGSTSMVPFVP